MLFVWVQIFFIAVRFTISVASSAKFAHQEDITVALYAFPNKGKLKKTTIGIRLFLFIRYLNGFTYNSS